jgi:Tfp pilus assembly protein PilF
MVSQRTPLRRIAGGLVIATLAIPACSMLPPSSPAGAARPQVAPSSSEPSGGSAEAVARTGNEASTALLAQARSEREAGSLEQATASIERALRIAPNDPELWLELGEIKLADGDREQAQMMARKALTLAGNDRATLDRATRLLTP